MKELLEKPYYLRQFIVVERDEVILAKAKRQEELENEEKKNLIRSAVEKILKED